MNIITILAGGTGTRLKNSIPKQFIELHGKPIILYAIDDCLKSGRFDYIIIAVHKDFLQYTKELLHKNDVLDKNIIVIEGGKERIDTINNVVNYVDDNIVSQFDNSIEHGDIFILFHDSVRPFCGADLLDTVLDDAIEYGASHAASRNADTMIFSEDGEFETSLLDRAKIFNGESPDGFSYLLFKKALNSLNAKQRETLTGTAQIVLATGRKVKLTISNSLNFKITTQKDLDLANALLCKKD